MSKCLPVIKINFDANVQQQQLCTTVFMFTIKSSHCTYGFECTVHTYIHPNALVAENTPKQSHSNQHIVMCHLRVYTVQQYDLCPQLYHGWRGLFQNIHLLLTTTFICVTVGHNERSHRSKSRTIQIFNICMLNDLLCRKFHWIRLWKRMMSNNVFVFGCG